MKTDWLTKLLLALIAAGLFLNALVPVISPRPVSAQSEDISGNVSNIERYARQIANGTCTNSKICN